LGTYGVLSSVSSEDEAGDRNHNKQDWSDGSDGVESDGSTSTQCFVMDEGKHCVLKHLPGNRDHPQILFPMRASVRQDNGNFVNLFREEFSVTIRTSAVDAD
jgi:hypothetical protein